MHQYQQLEHMHTGPLNDGSSVLIRISSMQQFIAVDISLQAINTWILHTYILKETLLRVEKSTAMLFCATIKDTKTTTSTFQASNPVTVMYLYMFLCLLVITIRLITHSLVCSTLPNNFHFPGCICQNTSNCLVLWSTYLNCQC